MAGPELTKHQAFRVERISREQISGADYNPRVISDKEKKRLRGLLKKHGFVETLVWNRRSGTLVSGHQRLSILDALEGGKPYSLDVAVVDVDEKRERELNVALNNANAQGDYDLDKLATLLRTDGLDLDGTGFDSADVYRLFGDSVLTAHEGALDDLAERLRAATETYNQIREKSSKRDGVDFFTVLVWRNDEARDEAHRRLGLDDNRYQDGRTLLAKLAPAPDGDDADGE